LLNVNTLLAFDTKTSIWCACKGESRRAPVVSRRQQAVNERVEQIRVNDRVYVVRRNSGRIAVVPEGAS
jgi:hypothetical protein